MRYDAATSPPCACTARAHAVNTSPQLLCELSSRLHAISTPSLCCNAMACNGAHNRPGRMAGPAHSECAGSLHVDDSAHAVDPAGPHNNHMKYLAEPLQTKASFAPPLQVARRHARPGSAQFVLLHGRLSASCLSRATPMFC